MITRTIKISEVEYKVYNREIDQVNTIVTDLYGTFADEESIKKALKPHLLSDDTVLTARVTDVTTQKFGMTIDQFVATAVKLDE